MMNPEIAIIGAGAVGSLLGGMLALAGKNVTLIGNKSHMAAIRENGLVIHGIPGGINIRLRTAEQLEFKPDVAFIGVKTQDVEKTCRLIKPHTGNIPVVMMQNGIRSAQIAGDILGRKNIMSCILLLNAKFTSPGHVTYVNKNPIVLGNAFSGEPERLEQIRSLLNRLSDTTISHNILAAQWSKLFINAMSNSMDAMTGLNLGGAMRQNKLRKIGVLILKEALNIVDKSNIRLENLPGIPVTAFRFIIKLPTPLASLLLKPVMATKGNTEIITSTLQSIKNGKKTEIDFLNGEFVRLAQKNGLLAPVNSKVVEIIHTIEQTRRFYSPKELATIFGV